MEENKMSRFRDVSEEEDDGSDHHYKWLNDREDESSMAGEISVESDLSEEENLEEEEEEEENEDDDNFEIASQPDAIEELLVDKKKSFDMDDVGTDEDLESHKQANPKAIANKEYHGSDEDLITDMSDMSDIEDQMSVAHSKLMEDKQSLRSVMGFVDEVTHKGEILAKKASETHLPALSAKMSAESNLNDPFSLLEEEDQGTISFYSPYGRGPMKDYDESQLVGQVEYLANDDRLANSGGSQGVDDVRKNDDSETDLRSVVSMSSKGDKRMTEKVLSGSGNISDEGTSNGTLENPAATTEHDSSPGEEVIHLTSSLDKEMYNFVEEDNDEEETWEDPECSISRISDHVCCGGGGDGGREMEIISKLNKLKNDIIAMREELTNARKECKKESEEVSKLIEEAVARNKAAEIEDSKISTVPALMTPVLPKQIFGSQLTDDLGSQGRLVRSHIGNRAQSAVALPTSVLEERLRSTRHTASTTYRETLNELEKMVEKEMASIQDSMTRLEPLNKMAAEWDTLQKLRSMTTYKRDYRMEMVMSETRIKPEMANE